MLALLSSRTHCFGIGFVCWPVPTWGFVNLAAPVLGLVVNFLLFPSLAHSFLLALFLSQTYFSWLVLYSGSSAVPLWWLGVLPHVALVVVHLL